MWTWTPDGGSIGLILAKFWPRLHVSRVGYHWELQGPCTDTLYQARPCSWPGINNYDTILYASMTNLTIRTTNHKAEESQSWHYFVSMNKDHSTFPEYAKSQDQDFYMVSLWYPICTSKWKNPCRLCVLIFVMDMDQFHRQLMSS